MLLSRTSQKDEIGFVILVTLIMLMLSLPVFVESSWAEDSALIETQESKKLDLTIGKSVILTSPKPLKRVSIADPEVADFVLISPHELYVTGKAAGFTNLTMWTGKRIFGVYDLEVAYDISRLKQRLHQVLPNEEALQVMATHDSITLSGRISSSANLTQAMAIAHAYAPEGKVHNLLEVGGVHQIMLEVRVAEVSRSLLKNLGVNFTGVTETGKFYVSKLAGLTEIVDPADANIETGGPFGLFVTPAVNALFRFRHNGTDWTGFVDALKQDGMLKILAEPTLITLSGQTAEFLAGGEFPVPVPQGLGTVGIEYKQFGVQLRFAPTVLNENKINIKVAPSVSELDYSVAVLLEGFVVPGLSTRSAETVIELADGQSFAIAGLISDTVRESIDKIPLLGDIPILGPLFRSSSFRKQETELVIIATPHLVKPLNKGQQPLPTDFYLEPNDMEFYFWGLLEGREKNPSPTPRAELDGEFGHALPAVK